MAQTNLLYEFFAEQGCLSPAARRCFGKTPSHTLTWSDDVARITGHEISENQSHEVRQKMIGRKAAKSYLAKVVEFRRGCTLQC